MATIISRPTKIVYGSNVAPYLFRGAVDNDPSSYGSSRTHITESSSMSAILGGYDFSALPSIANIKNIAVYIKTRSTQKGVTLSHYLIKEATSVSNFTDLGDGERVLASSTQLSTDNYYSVSYPVAASAITADFLKSGALQSRCRYAVTVSAGSTVALLLYDLYIEVEYELPTFTVTAEGSPVEGGTVTGGGTYEHGTTVTLTATPNDGYKFKQWSDGNTANPRTVTVTSNVTYMAEFAFDKVNKIYVGNSLVKGVYVGNTPVKAVYVGSTKKYG